MRTLSIVAHGESGVGKSWLADTAPAPRLILDAEGGSQDTPSEPKMVWNPLQYAPPGVQGCEPGQEYVPPTTRVMIRDWQTMQRVYTWLNTGQHFFTSLGLDSLTEIQKRCMDDIADGSRMDRGDWGDLLTAMEKLVRQMRDLTFHPTKPLQCVAILALSEPDKKGATRPFIKGQLGLSLPGFVDVVGYMYTGIDPQTGQMARNLLIQPAPGYVAKDRTHKLTQAYGNTIVNPDLATMLAIRNGYSDYETMLAVMEGAQAQ